MEMNSFTYVRPWMDQILQAIRKDIKTDHLPADKFFYKTHFGNRPLNKLTQEEIFAVYEKELLSGNQELGEWVINRWVFKYGDLYRHFAERLSAITPNFQEIQALTDAQAEQVLAGAQEKFGFAETYIFARLNSVVFSDAFFDRLHQAALQETQSKKQVQIEKNEQESLDQLNVRHQRELSRLQEKFEDKLSGIQRKYISDVEALKKQIRSLQQQLSAPKMS
jgi:hypothetical protein